MKTSRSRTWVTALGLLLLLVSGAIIGAVGYSAYATHRLAKGRRGGRPGMRSMVLHRVCKDLSLDEAQRRGVDEVLTGMAGRASTLHDRHMDEIQDLVDETLVGLGSVLSGEQMDQLRERHAEFEHSRPTLGRPPGPFGIGRDIREAELDLTPEQEQQLQAITEKYSPTRRAAAHSQPEQVPETSMHGPHGHLLSLNGVDVEIETILTDEQMRKFREFRSRRNASAPTREAAEGR